MRKKGGEWEKGASLTAAASAYKDDGFVNYGAHGDDSLRSARASARAASLLRRTSLSVTIGAATKTPSAFACSASSPASRINTRTRSFRVPCKDRHFTAARGDNEYT